MSLDNAAVNSRLVVILVIIVGLISAVGVIISAVAMGKPSAPDITISTNNHPIALDWLLSNSNANPPTKGESGAIGKRDLAQVMQYARPNMEHQAKSIWTVAMGYDNGAHDYRSDDGTVQGFGRDLVEAVCATMGVECRVVYDRYQNCWTSTAGHYSSGGQGLLGQWYDACVGWSPTRERMNVFNFSPSYTDPVKSKLYVKAGEGQKVHDSMQKVVGFVNGFVADEQCLTKGKKHMPRDAIVYADNAAELVQLLNDGKVSAIFADDNLLVPYIKDSGLTAVEGDYACTNDGHAVMTRKDNTFLSMWNKGMDKLKEAGAFKNICEDVQKVHSGRGTIKCNEE